MLGFLEEPKCASFAMPASVHVTSRAGGQCPDRHRSGSLRQQLLAAQRLGSW